MAAEASSGIDQRLILDHSSFEKLLAAAWVLQCMQDQLHVLRVEGDETIAHPVAVKRELEIPSAIRPAKMQPEFEFALSMAHAGSGHDSFTAHPHVNDPIAKPVETLRSQQTGSLNFDDATKTKSEPVELEEEEEKEILHSEKRATIQPMNAPLARSTNLPATTDGAWTRCRAAFNFYSANRRIALQRALNGFAKRLPPFRIRFTLRALRAVAIATPVWILSLVAASLFLEVWRHGSFQSAQAISKASMPTVAAAASNTSATLTTPAQTVAPAPAAADFTPANKPPRAHSTDTPLETSHKHITDGTTQSAVEELSRYELQGLRRQARYGDESAAFTLGMAYEVGHFVPQSCNEAARWVIRAAEADNSAAEYNLGLRYRDGDGVPADRALSNKWLRKAAALRNRQAKQALKMLASR